MSKEKQKGITLIALVITIIVMLILVAVSVTVALNGGLFDTAKKASKGTELERDKELELSDGQIKVDGEKYTSYQDYLDKKPMIYLSSIEGLASGVSLIPQGDLTGDLKDAATTGKIKAVLKETTTVNGVETTYTAVVPVGFQVSTTDGEDSISGGLVIYDGTDSNRNNEFVWIPVTEEYTEDNLGPLTGKHYDTGSNYDSQEVLDYYYGTGYYNYNDFTYETDKTNIVTSINKYDGFYVGRYETTYDSLDENNVPKGIGVKNGKNTLGAFNILQTGKNTTSNDGYYYRWWGLYKAQKDMYIKNENVFSSMITNKEWGKIQSFIVVDLRGITGTADDVNKNIYQLAKGACELTLTSSDNSYDEYKMFRGVAGRDDGGTFGSYYGDSISPSNPRAYMSSAIFGSRATLYIK